MDKYFKNISKYIKKHTTNISNIKKYVYIYKTQTQTQTKSVPVPALLDF